MDRVLQPLSDGEFVAVATSVLGLTALAVRVCGRVALAWQQRRAMTTVARSLAEHGRAGRIRQNGDEWSVVLHPPRATDGPGPRATDPSADRGAR